MSAYLFEIFDKGNLDASDLEHVLCGEALFSASRSAAFYPCIARGTLDEYYCLSRAAVAILEDPYISTRHRGLVLLFWAWYPGETDSAIFNFNLPRLRWPTRTSDAPHKRAAGLCEEADSGPHYHLICDC
jgi:hypothetical protein